MANLHINSGLADDQISREQDLDEQEVMPKPWVNDLENCQPKIIRQLSDGVPTEDRDILEELQSTCEGLSAQLQRSITFQAKIQKVYEETKFCIQYNGSEDFWSYLSVWSILKLARKLSGLGHVVRALPLTTATVSPTSLLPQWNGTKVSRKIDFGLVIKLDDDITQRIQGFTDQEDDQHGSGSASNDDSGGGVGPAATVPILSTHPLFCHIEVKQQNQVVDPVVQLAVWTSAVYTRWEQVKASHSSSPRDFPVSFSWAVQGRYWRLYLVRRLADGSRRITEHSRLYDTLHTVDIYLVVATLYYLIHYGHKEFREQFLDSVLDIQS